MTNLADNLDLWGFESDLMVFKDGSLGFGLELESIDITFKTDDDVNDVHETLKSLLSSLTDGIQVQLIKNFIRPTGKELSDHRKMISSGSMSVAKELAEDRILHFERKIKEDSLSEENLFLFVRLPSLGDKEGRNGKIKSSKRSNFVDEEIKKTELILASMTDDFLAGGLKSRQLTRFEISKHLFAIWNPDLDVSGRSFPLTDVSDSFLFSDVMIDRFGFTIGDTYHRVLSLKLLPAETYAGMGEVLSGLPIDSTLYVSLRKPDQSQVEEKLKTQRRLSYAMVSGAEGVRDLEGEEKFGDIEEVLEEVIRGDEQIFEVSVNVVLRSKNETDLDSQKSFVLSKIRELAGSEAMVETAASFPIFASVSPPNSQSRERLHRMKSSNAADFLPLYGNWAGHKNPSVLFKNRADEILSFDPFSAQLTNANQLISGGSGAGKSYLTNKILMQMLKENPKIFIIDIGGSYEKTARVLGGEYIELSLGKGLSINPFDLAEGETSPGEEKIKFLVSLVEVMAREDGASGLPRLERSELEQVIIDVYGKPKPKLSDLRKALAASKEPALVRIGRILQSWCGDTPYGKLLDRETTIQLTKDTVCFDLKGLESHKDLQACALFIITDLVWREVKRDRERKKIAVFDECWSLLENEAGANFIGTVFRTFRKYRAGAIAISQTVDDFSKSKVADAILANSEIKWLLQQKGSNKESLAKVLSLNENELSAVNSLRQKKGEYSEGFLMAGDDRAIAVIDATPLEYWLSTSDAGDLSAIEKFKKENPDTSELEVLKKLAAIYPSGSQGAKEAV